MADTGDGMAAPSGRERTLSSTVWIGAPVVLFFAALAVRVVSWNSVFLAARVMPFGNDAFYHLRRIRYSVEHFPTVLDFDPLINYPHGAQPIWSPTFDWLMAAWLILAGAAGDPQRLERLAMWAPPVVGAATVVLLYFVGRRFFSRGVGLLAAALLLVLPAHFYYSKLGFVDHHVLVAGVTTWLLAATMDWLREPDAAASGDGGVPLRRSALLGLAMAASLLVWPGSLIHVGIVQAALAVHVVTASTRTSSVSRARRCAVVHTLACVSVLPLCAGNEWIRWGHMSPLVLSDFQPVYLGATALGFGLLGGLCRWGRLAADRRARAVVAVLGGAMLAVLAFLGMPELRGIPGDAWAWLVKAEEFQATVSESTPLFAGAASGGGSRAVKLLGAFVYAVPVAIAYLAWRSRGRADRLFLLWWTLALFAATLTQWRFMNSYAVAHSLLLAWVLRSAREDLSPRLHRKRWVARIAGALTVAACTAAIAPSLASYAGHLSNVRRGLSGAPPELIRTVRKAQLVADTADWLRGNSPPPVDPGYSVLAPWGDGHILKYVGERPVVQDNFGDDVSIENFALAEAYFAARDEETALEILAKTRTRYVLVRSIGSGHSQGYASDSLFSRLYHLKGSRGQLRARSSRRSETASALASHRLIYESPPLREGFGRSFCMLFEIVPGAELRGRADPGATVRVSLALETRADGAFDYFARSRADEEGTYRLRLPYANDAPGAEVRVDDRYRVESGDVSASVAIREAAVRDGAVVAGPDLRATSL